MSLTKKQEAFAQAILTEGSKSDAYRKAFDSKGMSDKSIHENASKLANHTKVAPRILELQRRAQERNDITADRVLAEYSLIAFADLSKTILITGEDGQPDFGSTDTKHKKIIGTGAKDKIKALNDLSRHLGLFEADNDQQAGMSKSFEELEELHQRKIAAMKEKKAKLIDRGSLLEKELSG